MIVSRRTYFTWLIILGWLVIFIPEGLSQSVLSGKITDKQSGEPIPYANIFFANTTLGASSLTDGTFEINRIPNGKYDLLVEIVGYRRHKQPLEFQDQKYHIEISMAQDTVLLESITVMADQSDKKYASVFFKFFVGDGPSAKDCKILNPEALHFYFDKKKNYLTVHAREPVRIINPTLGYTVHYTLERFGLDFTTGTKIIEGNPRFEELPARRRSDSVAWQKKRNKAYRGSVFHFMRSLYRNDLHQEKFNVSIADSSRTTDTQEVLLPFEPSGYLSGDRVKQLRFKGLLKMEYRANEDWTYPGMGIGQRRGRNPNGFQQTYLRLKDPSIDIYENGYYADQLSIYLHGYLVWRETVCNMVPLGHEVMTKRKKKK